ncbi:hypothetical protein [Streptomyces sp. NPDC002133]|uniref:hypothetical protein n=1 Tax=Streptomyces sp. NPDC002133 TaxID=3154409 RepID=UPI003317EEA3
MFVHTHHLRPSLPTEGGTAFHFTDEPAETALRRAFEAAEGKDVRLGGGPATIRQYLRDGLVDELLLVHRVPSLPRGGSWQRTREPGGGAGGHVRPPWGSVSIPQGGPW